MTSNQKEQSECTIVLTHAHLSRERVQEYFPTADLGKLDIRAARLKSGHKLRAVGFLGFERVSATSVSVHTFLLKDYRVPSVVKLLKRDMLGNLQKYMEEEDIQTIIAVCDYDNRASMRLQKLMGYEPQPYWMGVQHRR